MTLPALSELQSAFKRYLFAGDNEAKLTGLVRSTRPVPAGARLEVYRNAFYTRLQDALAHDFPALLAAAGDETFGRLATEYLREHPSTRASLRWLGRQLPEWLRQRGEGPVWADLAALEYAVLHAFDAADAPVLSARDFDEISPGHWPELRLTLHPSLSLLAVRANVRPIWSAVRHSLLVPAPRAISEWLVIWRSSSGPSVEAVNATWSALLVVLMRGETFAAACETLAESMPPEEVPTVAAQCLHHALARGWVSAVWADG
ncbi:MAG: DNA-binding domain-containing protein [Thermoanaerobaculia bacterium]